VIDPKSLIDALDEIGVDFASGVPDSLMEPLCTYLATRPGDRHVLAANEGAAVGVAIGHYLSTGEPALVYLQNAGIGNAINPLVSLADPDVYGIPMLLLVGWRGQPGVPDEPQHVTQGRLMKPILDGIEVPHTTLPRDLDDAISCLTAAVDEAKRDSSPYVVLVEKGTFAPYQGDVPASADDEGLSSRENALVALLDATGDEGVIVATTGMLGRELYEHREQSGSYADRDFLAVGGMGHCCSIALGIALRNPHREVWCLDGDGSVLMHLGSLAVVADQAPENLYHVVFNNGVHDSVGGQATAMRSVDLPATALALGYRHAVSVSDVSTLGEVVAEMRARRGPALVDLRVRPGNREGIGRPERSPAQARAAFMAALD
jgi:phosphonopyruvate decarboxylase